MNYDEFIDSKSRVGVDSGFDPVWMPDFLFPFQQALTGWAVKKGRAAIFADCGLGKTAMQLVWAQNVVEKTNKPVLILTPLAVARQTIAEAAKFGIPAKYVRHQSECAPGINVTNFEMLHEFDTSAFSGAVIDESSILKSFMGKRKREIIAAFAATPYKLACTATPAPNDHMELGNHSDFLGVMKGTEMLSRYFINDAAHVGRYRVKGHAQGPFWKWVCSWAATVAKPSDIGFSDDGFILPKCKTEWTTVDCTKPVEGFLFQLPASSLSERIGARRASVVERVEAAARIAEGDEQWIIYCGLNAESELLARSIDGAVEVRGSMTNEAKVDEIGKFINGETRCLVSKPTICGFGMNFQFCRNVMFVGLSDSWEQYYQAKRRVWRFGQKRDVNCHVITASTENAVVENIMRKESDAATMMKALCEQIGGMMQSELRHEAFAKPYEPTQTLTLPTFL